MSDRALFSTTHHIRKFFNTFCPRLLRSLSPKKHWMKNHWRDQEEGDIHGYDKYTAPTDRVDLLAKEIGQYIAKEGSILDLGCNCGLYLKKLQDSGYSNLTGIDISKKAIEYGRQTFALDKADLIPGSFEDVLPRLIAEKRSFNLIYSMGATIELVHPSFDVIGSICTLSDDCVILIISEWGHAYPRFYEYEFNRQGFLLVKAIRPYNGCIEEMQDPSSASSLLVFRKICR